MNVDEIDNLSSGINDLRLKGNKNVKKGINLIIYCIVSSLQNFLTIFFISIETSYPEMEALIKKEYNKLKFMVRDSFDIINNTIRY